jgi:hypothetical protein
VTRKPSKKTTTAQEHKDHPQPQAVARSRRDAAGKTTTKKARTTKKAKSKTKTKGNPKTKTSKPASPSWRLVEIFVRNPAHTASDLLAALKDEGLTLSRATANTITSIARSTIRSMTAAGWRRKP